MSSEFLRRQAVIRLAKGWEGPMRATVKPKAKRRMDIEALLGWAYLVELPKQPRDDGAPSGVACAWDAMGRFAEELPLAGLEPNVYGVVPDRFASDGPCDNALRVHAAVCSLDEFEPEMPEGWPWMDQGEGADAALLGRYAEGVRRSVFRIGLDGRPALRFALPHLMQHHAIMGTAPDWGVDAYVHDVERWPNGKPKYFRMLSQWVDGARGPVEERFEVAVQCRLRDYPEPDALYCKDILTPDPTDAYVDRARYEVWRAALDVLAYDLEGQLDDIDVLPSGRSREPWVEGEAPKARVLPSLVDPKWLIESRRVRGRQKKTSSAA